MVSFESEVYFQRSLADKIAPKENVVVTTTKRLHNNIAETMFDIGKFSIPGRLFFWKHVFRGNRSTNLKGHALILFQEHVQLTNTDPQIACCELVGDVKTKRSKFPPFERDTMKETQGKEQKLELFLDGK